MVEVVLTPAGARYRLHELIRLYGASQLRETGPAGCAAQAAWRRRLVCHFTEWLRHQSELFRFEDLSALQSFDAERHNIEHAIAVAEAEAPSLFPRLLASGRMLLRQRFDHGSRRALLRTALDIITAQMTPSHDAPAVPHAVEPSFASATCSSKTAVAARPDGESAPGGGNGGGGSGGGGDIGGRGGGGGDGGDGGGNGCGRGGEVPLSAAESPLSISESPSPLDRRSTGSHLWRLRPPPPDPPPPSGSEVDDVREYVYR